MCYLEKHSKNKHKQLKSMKNNKTEAIKDQHEKQVWAVKSLNYSEKQ